MSSKSIDVIFPWKKEHGLIAAVLLLSLLPAIGITLGLWPGGADPASSFVIQDTTGMSSAEFTSLEMRENAAPLVEWVGFCAALFTLLLCGVHYAVRQDLTPVIVALTLCAAGSVDAFHALSSSRYTLEESENLVQLTRAFSRSFSLLLLIVGGTIVRASIVPGREQPFHHVVLPAVVMGALAYGAVSYCAASVTLTRTSLHNQQLTRLWSFLPFLLLLCAALYVYLPLHRKEPSHLSRALLLGMLPQLVAQVHLYHSQYSRLGPHDLAASGLLSLGLVMPFAGLCMDIVSDYRKQTTSVSRLKEVRDLLVERRWSAEQIKHELEEHMTARTRAEEALKKLISVYRYHPQPVIGFAQDGSPVLFNDAALKLVALLGAGSSTALLPHEVPATVRRTLRLDQKVEGMRVLIAGRVLEWSFHPDPHLQLVFGYGREVSCMRALDESEREAARSGGGLMTTPRLDPPGLTQGSKPGDN